MCLMQARGGLQAFEATLRKLGGNGGTVVSLDDMTIALSRVNASLTLDDIREFYKAFGGVTRRPDGSFGSGDEQ